MCCSWNGAIRSVKMSCLYAHTRRSNQKTEPSAVVETKSSDDRNFGPKVSTSLNLFWTEHDVIICQGACFFFRRYLDVCFCWQCNLYGVRCRDDRCQRRCYLVGQRRPSFRHIRTPRSPFFPDSPHGAHGSSRRHLETPRLRRLRPSTGLLNNLKSSSHHSIIMTS